MKHSYYWSSNYSNHLPIASLPLVVSLLLLLCILSLAPLAQTRTYYVVPSISSQKTTCEELDLEKTEPCMTLSEYSTQPSDYFETNTTLILLPGDHELDGKILSFGGLYQLEIIANTSVDYYTTVLCTNRAILDFHNITSVKIRGLVESRCYLNSFVSITELILEDCFFNGGLGYNASATQIKNVQSATITGMRFSGNTGIRALSLDENQLFTVGALSILNSSVLISDCLFDFNINIHVGFKTRGGAIYAKQSTINMYNSTFIGNQAQYGGVLFLHSNVQINIISCLFYKNGALRTSGVIFAQTFSQIMINDCYFDRNEALNSSGTISADNDTIVTIRNSMFQNNVAGELGGALTAFYQCTVIMEGVYFENNTVAVIDSNFGSGGAIVAYNSSVSITECQFIGNSAVTGGALALGTSTYTNITSSEFTNNTAYGVGGALSAQLESITKVYDCTFSRNFSPRGGVMHNEDSSVTFQNSIMTENTAEFFGAAIQCHGYKSSGTSLNLINSTLSRNTVISGGGGVLFIYSIWCTFTSKEYLHLSENIGSRGLVFIQQGNTSFEGITEIVNNLGSVHAINSEVVFNGETTFANNTPHVDEFNLDRYPEGGAITLYDSSLLLNGNISITNNTAENGGGILAIQGTINTNGELDISNNRASVSGGGIYAYQTEISLEGIVTISDNFASQSGGGLHTISSTTEFNSGVHKLERNTAQYGGGMYLELNSQVYVIKRIKERYNCTEDYHHHVPCISDVSESSWLRLEFTENLAEYGGALFVKDAANSDTCGASSSSNYSNTPYLPTNECFFQTVSLYWNPNTLTTLHLNSTHFQDNRASLRGDTLYGGLLDRCTISPYAEANADEKTQNALQFLQSRSNIELDSISSDPVRVCFCQNGRPDCNYTPPTVEVIKGQTFTVSVVAVDQVNNTQATTVHALLSSQRAGLSEGELKQNTQENCTVLNYTVLSPNDNEQLILYAEGPCKDIGISNHSVEVLFLPCPIGFSLTASGTNCDCDLAITPYITNCSIATSSLFRNGEFWIQNISNESTYLVYDHCPFDYCYPPTETVAINLNTLHGSDSQCSFNRSGLVCGECKPGLSLSLGSNHCRKCSNYWLFLLLPFSLAGIALVGLLMTLNLTVAKGTINGLIFYANIIAANRESLLPVKSPNVLTVFIAWLNLDFGVETCFYNGMDAYIKTWLQFAFPLYVMLLVAAIIVISDHSTKFAKLFTRKNPEATLATLILLSYTKILRTIIASLSFAQLDYPDGSVKTVWLLDPNVDYLKGKHIPLFITAVITAIIGIVFTLILLFWQWIIRYSDKTILKWTKNYKISCFPDAFHAPFNGKHRYWPGLLLITRTLLYLISAVNVLGDARVNLLAIICASILLFLFQKSLNKRVYKTCAIDMLEYTFIMNLAIFAAASFYARDEQISQIALAYTSISIALLIFIAIVIYHVNKFTFKDSTLLSKLRHRLKQCTSGRSRADVELPHVLDGGEDVLIPSQKDWQVEEFSESTSLTVVDVTRCAQITTTDSTDHPDTLTHDSTDHPDTLTHDSTNPSTDSGFPDTESVSMLTEELQEEDNGCSDTFPLLDISS